MAIQLNFVHTDEKSKRINIKHTESPRFVFNSNTISVLMSKKPRFYEICSV